MPEGKKLGKTVRILARTGLMAWLMTTATPAEEEHPASEIRIRDPFVLPVSEENAYYLYGTGRPLGELGFDAYRSIDLRQWEGPFPVFRPPRDFWGTRTFWAPEVHRYRGRYCLFGSFAPPEGKGHRGTHVLAADSPRGPFVPVGPRAQTPAAWDCLDGTLYVDDANEPWMVFCHEWIQAVDGEICAMRLNTELDTACGEAIRLFRASDAGWPIEMAFHGKKGTVTDGPFLHRHHSGALLMLWSSFAPGPRYAIGLARSASGNVLGPWTHEPAPWFQDDGGHAMLFRTFGGTPMIAFHQPNHTPEHLVIRSIEETADGLRLGPALGATSPADSSAH